MKADIVTYEIKKKIGNSLKRLFEPFWMGSNNVHNVRFGPKVFMNRPVPMHLVQCIDMGDSFQTNYVSF